MKKILSLLVLVSSISYAGEINLSAGSSATISPGETTKVYCDSNGGSAGFVIPKCRIEGGYGYSILNSKGAMIIRVWSLEEATQKVKELNEAGGC